MSVEYGFPLGRSLLLEIADGLSEKSKLREHMKACGFTYGACSQLQNELYLSGQPSVDAFLEQHKREVEWTELGKAAVAASLLTREVMHTLTDRSELRIYEYLWHQMSGSPGMYDANNLSVLTFNYDRSLEQYIRTVLHASHPEFREDVAAFERAVSKFEIIHLYGSLGCLESKLNSFLPYGPKDPARITAITMEAAKRIKLYHEARFDDDQVLERIKTLVQEAERICFLGFSFYPVNIAILKFCRLGQNNATKHYASAYGVKEGERDSIRNLLGFDIKLAAENAKCLEAIRTLPVLFTS